MSPSFEIVSPVGLESRERRSYAPRRGSLRGMKLGLLGNGKLNAIDLVKAVGEELKRQHGVAEFVVVQKAQRGAGVSADNVRDLARCDAVVNGVGD